MYREKDFSPRILLGRVAYVILFLNSPILGYFRKIFSDRSFWNMNIKPTLQTKSGRRPNSSFLIEMLQCLLFTKNVPVLLLRAFLPFHGVRILCKILLQWWHEERNFFVVDKNGLQVKFGPNVGKFSNKFCRKRCDEIVFRKIYTKKY